MTLQLFRLAEQLEKLRKNQERRLQRKNAKMGITGDVFLPGGKKVKPETTVGFLYYVFSISTAHTIVCKATLR